MKFIITMLLTLPLTSISFASTAGLVSRAGSLIASSPVPISTTSTSTSTSSSSLMAAQKKRRRKTVLSPPASPIAPSSSDDDLPEFDDVEDDGLYEGGEDERGYDAVGSSFSDPPSTPTSPRRKTNPSVVPIRRGGGLNPKLAEEAGGNVDGLDEGIILEAMRGRTGDNAEWQPPRSIQDTINDRSLEKLMDFDKMIERDGGGDVGRVELPDFDEVISRRKRRDATMGEGGRVEEARAAAASSLTIDTAGMGKKAARDAERRALAMQQREKELAEEGQRSPFSDLNILKVLENGAWVGIGLLVLWEFYINSPFFDRAAPLIPVVYDTLPPGM